MRNSTEYRVQLGNLHCSAGNFALAAGAFGNPRYLDSVDRKTRRWSLRRGLLQSRRVGLSAAMDLASFDPVSLPIARVLDEARLADQSARVHEILTVAIEEHGRHPWLLLNLAWQKGLDGDRHAKAALAAEAMNLAPEIPLVVSDVLWQLLDSDYDAQMLGIIAGLSEKMQDSSELRAAIGDCYDSWRLHGHTASGYGTVGLKAWRARRRRTARLLSGWRFSRLRSTAMAREQALLSGVPLPASQLAALSQLSLPGAVEAATRGELGAYRTGSRYRLLYKLETPRMWTDWSVLRTWVVAVAGGTFAAEYLLWPSTGVLGHVAVAASTTVAVALGVWIAFARMSRWATRLTTAVVSGTSAGLLLWFHGQWQLGGGLALAGVAGAILTVATADALFFSARRLLSARWQRWHAETGALTLILDLIGALDTKRARRDTSERRKWLTALEQLAVTAERYLPYALRSGDPDSQDAITARCRSAAAVLRDLKRTAAMPNEESLHAMTGHLNSLAVALASGNFDRWPMPQSAIPVTPVKRPLWWRLMQIGRTTLVIIGPPLVAFLVPHVAPVTGPGLGWLQSASLVWALLAAVVALDPALSDRIAKMRAMLSLLRDAMPPGGVGSQPGNQNSTDRAERDVPDLGAGPTASSPARPPTTRTTRTTYRRVPRRR